MYSYFVSRHEILDALVNEILKQYIKHSVFIQRDWVTRLYK